MNFFNISRIRRFKVFRKINTYLIIRKHLEGLVKDFPEDVQKIILSYNSIYSSKANLSDILSDASANLYYEISRSSPKSSSGLGEKLNKLNKIEL